MYKVNWIKLIRDATPPRLYNTIIGGWLSAIIKSINNLNDTFEGFAESTYNDVHYNGQVVHLEAALNSAFKEYLEPADKIEIKDAIEADLLILYEDKDANPIVLTTDNHARYNFIIHPDESYAARDYDFLVKVPFPLPEGLQYRMQSTINKFKLVGKRYLIEHPKSNNQKQAN